MKRLALALLLLPALLVAQVSTKSDVVYEAPDMTAGHAIPWCVTGKIIQSDGSVWQCVDLPSLVETDPQVGTMTANLWCAANGAGTAVVCDKSAPVTAESDPLATHPGDNETITGEWSFHDQSILAAESLTNGALTGGTSWSASGWTLAGNQATYSFGTALGSLYQLAAAMVTPVQPGRWYRFSYTYSSSMIPGVPPITLQIPAGVAVSALDLPQTPGVHSIDFKSDPSCSGDMSIQAKDGGYIAYSITLDDLSLKEIGVAPDLYVGGALYASALHVTTPLASSDITEADPQVGTLTASQWCTANAGGTAVDCTTASPLTVEVDPQVGTLTNTKWCTSDGSAVNCATNAPLLVEADTLTDVTTRGNTTSNNIGVGSITSGNAGVDGEILIYSEQGATDYLARLRPNPSMTSNAIWYLWPDEPTTTSFTTMTSGGVLGFIETIPATSVDDALTETDNAWITGGWTFDPSDGGSPFSVFSSTAVTNLNADFLDGKHEPYFVHHVSDYTLNHTNYQNLYFRSLCVNTMGGNSLCSSPTIDFTQIEAVTSDAQWDSYSPNAGGTNGLLATWTLTNSGSLFPAVNTWSLRLAEACHTAGCGYTARAIRDVLEVSVPNATGAATLLVDGAAVLTAEADGVVGNEVANVSGTTLTRSGTGTGGDPYLVALNLANANTWTGQQTSPYPVDSKHYSPDTPPAVANGASDEFDDAALGVMWSWHSGAAYGTVDEATYPGFLYISNADSAKADFLQQDEAIAENENFEIRGAFNRPAYGTSYIGIFAVNSVGTGWGCGIQAASGWSHVYHGAVTTWSQASTAVTTYEKYKFFSIKRTATNVITLNFSEDGMVWTELATASSNAALAYIGIYVNLSATGTATNPDAVTVDWIRRIN